MSILQSWPEPVVRVQSLAESNIDTIPEHYIKLPSDRPSSTKNTDADIPIIDLENIFGQDPTLREAAMKDISDACREWGFFQVVNHGMSHKLMNDVREIWREFFKLPMELKQEYANSPATYEGYGSRVGVEKGAILDWGDYFFLYYLPTSLRNTNRWPALPPSCRELVTEYSNEAVKLCGRLIKILSINLGLEEDYLPNAFGGEDIGATLRVNFYPKCPQPDLTLGLSPHSDPGGVTLLLPDEDVAGLQVRKGDNWVTVKSVPNAFIVNMGDQIQVMTNGIYKSVEHRVLANSGKERVSLAFFVNPKGDLLLQPAKELVTEDRPALYPAMTFDKYRLYIRTKGPSGKSQVESLKSAT